MAALVVVALGWLYVTGLQTSNARFKADLAAANAARQFAERQVVVMADEITAAAERAKRTNTIKETIREAAPGSVPADIRAAVDGLRHH